MSSSLPVFPQSPAGMRIARALIVVTFVIGFVMGWLFGAIWNWLHPVE